VAAVVANGWRDLRHPRAFIRKVVLDR